MSTEVAERSATRRRRWGPRAVAVLGGVFLLGAGLWAMLAAEAFFEAVATFEPFNAHLIRDVGAFMVGLGAVLLLAAAKPAVDALAVALCGVGVTIRSPSRRLRTNSSRDCATAPLPSRPMKCRVTCSTRSSKVPGRGR
jgi:hypothetical protein